MSIEDYVKAVVTGKYTDRTLSFQLKRGFKVINVVRNYLVGDPESLGYAAIIEWINHAVALPEDYADLANSPYKTPVKIKVDRVRKQRPQDRTQ